MLLTEAQEAGLVYAPQEKVLSGSTAIRVSGWSGCGIRCCDTKEPSPPSGAPQTWLVEEPPAGAQNARAEPNSVM